MSMQKLARGVHNFQKGYFARNRETFEKLANEGQNPDTLFITCSDSRVLPNHITGAGPGELFIVRNVGNVIPKLDLIGGTASAIEFGVKALGVTHMIVCGHTKCGAMEAILDPSRTESMPMVRRWLQQTARVRDVIAERYAGLSPEAQRVAAVQENVLMQLETLREYDFVSEAMDAGRLVLSGWVFDVETGNVFDYDPTLAEFVPLALPDPTSSARAL